MKRILLFTSIMVLMFCMASYAAGLTYVDLNNWTNYGIKGTWQVQPGGRTVLQTENTTPATFFLAPDQDINVVLRATISVDHTDDDFIGLVFGYQRPLTQQDPTNPQNASDGYEFILFDWSEDYDLTQGNGYKRLSIANCAKDDITWSHEYRSGPGITDFATTDTGGGWSRNTEYLFEILYHEDQIKVKIDGVEIFNVTPADAGLAKFTKGFYGFYNLSQPQVTYGKVKTAPGSDTQVPPIAADDNYGTSINTTLNVDRFEGIAANDYDPNLDTATIVIVQNVSHGTLTPDYDTGAFAYIPDTGYTGADTFTYKLVDSVNSNESNVRTVTIGVFNNNQTPTDIQISNDTIGAGSANGTEIGTFTTTDADTDDQHDYMLIDNGGGRFTVSGDKLEVADSQNLTSGSYTITVRSTDLFGAYYDKQFTITVASNNAPSGGNDAISTVINTSYTFAASDFTFSDPDSDSFGGIRIESLETTGDLEYDGIDISVGTMVEDITKLIFKPFTDENGSPYATFTFKVKDNRGGLSVTTYTMTIDVTGNPNSPPTNINLSSNTIDENQNTGTDVGTFSTIDSDIGDSHTYSLVTGSGDTDNGSFTILGDSLKSNVVFDFEVKDSYSIRVRTTDSQGEIFENSFTISINNLNETPTDINLSSNTIDENQNTGTDVGTFSTIDPDNGDSHSYTLVAGTGDIDNGSFTIVGNTLKSNEIFNFEVKDSYSIRVRTTDSQGETFDKIFIISIGNINDSPSDISINDNTINENQNIGTTIGTFTTSDEDSGDSHTYSLVVGSGDVDNGSFIIDGDTLKSSEVFNFETKNSYSIRVRTNDGNGGSYEKVFLIAINNINDTPTDISINDNTIDENQNIGTTIGTFTTSDEDSGDSHTYSLVVGSGDVDNGSFIIDGDTLKSSEVFNFETKNSYSIRVRTNDGNGGSYEKVFLIAINNINDTPTDISINDNTIDENQNIGTTIGTFSTADEDSGDTHTYLLVAGAGDTDNGSFTISGDLLKSGKVFDFEMKNSFSIRVRTDDGNGGSYEEVLTITINNINDTPTDISISDNTINENLNIGTAIGTFGTADEDSGDTHTYSLVSGVGDTDNGSFTIAGDILKSNEVFDFETKNSYSIRVKTDDGNGGSYEEVFLITINDINDAPIDIILSSNTVDENQNLGALIGTFTTNDADSGATHSYTLVSGTGDTDNSSFTIDGDTLKSNEVFNFEVKSSYSIRVRTDDGNGGTFEETFTIIITDINDAPTDISIDSNTIDENQSSSTIIGTFSTIDPDNGDSHSYTLVSGTGDTDNGSFTIDGNILKSNEVFNFEVKSSYSIRVRTDDGNGGIFEETFTIIVTDINDGPTDISIDSNAIDENQSSSTIIGTFSTIDPDNGDSHSYTLVSGTGDTDNGSFTIDGNILKSNKIFNFETKDSYFIRVRTTDSEGETYEESFTITINDINDIPVAQDKTVTTPEDTGYVFTAADFNYSDEDSDPFAKIEITELESRGSLLLNGNDVTLNEEINKADIDAGNLIFVPVQNENGIGYDSFKFRVHDGTVYSTNSYTMTLNVDSENDQPEIADIEDKTIREGEELSFTVVVSDNETPRADLDIATEGLPVKASFDTAIGAFSWKPSYEDAGIYQVTFTVSDGELSATKTVAITVEDVDRPNIVFEKEDIYDGDTLQPQNIITYRLTIYNIGEAALVDAVVKDTIPSNTSYLPESTKLNGVQINDINDESPLLQGMAINSPGAESGKILVGEDNAAIVEYSVRVLEDVTIGTNISSQATLYGSGEGSNPIQPVLSDDPDTEVLNDSTNSIISGTALIDAKKTVTDDNGDQVEGGDILTYTITVYNIGSANATNVVLSDPIPDETTFVDNSVSLLDGESSQLSTLSTQTIKGTSIPFNINGDGEIEIELGTLASQSSRIIKFQVKVKPQEGSGDEAVDVIISQGTVSSVELPDEPTDEDGDDSNGDQPTKIAVGLYPILNATMEVKDLNGGIAKPGDELEYTITITNQGTAPASNLNINSVIPAELEYLTGTTLLNGELLADIGSDSPVVSGIDYGAIIPNETVMVKYRVKVTSADEVTIDGQADYTAIAPAAETGKLNDENISGSTDIQTARVQLGASPGSGTINGDTEESWTVELYYNDQLLDTRVTDADGNYNFKGLKSGDYQVMLKHPETGVVYAIDTVAGLSSGVEADALLAMNPTGIIYDSIGRQPVENAIVTLLSPDGEPVPEDQLLPGQQGQRTGSDGYYKFELTVTDGSLEGKYEVVVSTPDGYNKFFPSVIVEPETDSFEPPVGQDPYRVTEIDAAPQTGEDTTYYLTFDLKVGNPDITNNHIPIDPDLSSAILITKTADKKRAAIGDFVTYTLKIENLLSVEFGPFTIQDIIPAGFKYVEGSARLNGEQVETNGVRPISWDEIIFEGKETIEIKYTLLIGSGVAIDQPYTNKVTAIHEETTETISNLGEAVIDVVGEPMFAQPLIIGKVFVDKNDDGIQQEDEVGLQDVGLYTVGGKYILTDEYGRYHINVEQIVNFYEGVNFILKLDTATLPTEAVLTTENPRVIKLTGGLIQKINFGVKLQD